MTTPKQLHLDIQLDESIKLSKFINCETTKFLIKNLENFLLDNSLTNFIFIWGNKGVGKSYLLRAVNQEFFEKKKTTAFLSFSNLSLYSPSVFDGLETLDTIFIDDIHLFPKSKEWEEAFFNFINCCINAQTKLLISSEKIVKRMSLQLPDLESRLLAFTAIEVPEIQERHKITALLQAADRKGIRLGKKELAYILNHTSRSLSDLLKLLSDLDRFSLEKQRKLSIPLIKEMISTKDNS